MPGMFIQIKVEGMDKLLGDLASLESAIVEAVKTGLYEKELEMETEMKGESPHKSGHMRRMIKAEEPVVES